MKQVKYNIFKEIIDVLVHHKDNLFIELFERNYGYIKKASKLFYDKTANIDIIDKEFEYIPLSKTIEMSRDFLDKFNSSWALEFDKLINDGTFIFVQDNDEELKDEYLEGAYYNVDSNIETINIPLYHNIEDVKSVVHEFIHSRRQYLGDISNDGEFLSESSAIAFEYLLIDYFEKKNEYVEDYKNAMLDRIINDFSLKAERLYNLATVYEVLRKDEDMMYYVSQTKENDKTLKQSSIHRDGIEEWMKYFLGNLVAMKIYSLISNGVMSKENLILYTTKLGEKDNLDSLNFIGGDFPKVSELSIIIDNILSKIFDLNVSNNLK